MLGLKKIEEECCWDLVNEEEIFCRLPAKELQRLKSVCKNWYRVISSPEFFNFDLSRINKGRIRFLIQKDWSTIIEYSDQQMEEIRCPPLISGRRSKFLGSCDGLLCLLLIDGWRNHTVAVYNPTTAKYFWVKNCPTLKRNHVMNCSWFGYHPSLKEYVLVLEVALLDDGKSSEEVGVYRLSGSSKLECIHSTQIQIQIPAAGLCPYKCYRAEGVLLHGAVHWAAKWGSRHVISVYHLDRNEYSEILSPAAAAAAGTSYPTLGVNNADECLFTIFKSCNVNAVFEMWVMKKYGVEQNWTKYANIEGFARHNIFLKPLGFFPNGDLILNVDRQELTKYSFDDRKPTLVLGRNFKHYGESIMCADSLVFPTQFH